MLFLLIVVALAQNEDALVAELGSDSIEAREEAQQKLKDAGPAALPFLRKAALHEDREIAERAKHLLRLLEVAPLLTPSLRKALPGIEERLASGGESVWGELLQECCERGTLTDKDRDYLLARAEAATEALCMLEAADSRPAREPGLRRLASRVWRLLWRNP